ncbi:MAG: hypothetical protein HC909_01925 [Blastochloris sp.]|nr:hypothetical protein [Blastochloris sp.]
MSDFSPVWPRSIGGNSYRLPLDHDWLEAVAARMDRQYRRDDISEKARGGLLKAYADLAKLDGANWPEHIFDNGIIVLEPTVAPMHPIPRGGGELGAIVGQARAWLRRLVAWLDRIEGLDKPTSLPLPPSPVEPPEPF